MCVDAEGALAMPLNFGEVGTDCAKDAERVAIQQRVFDRAAKAMAGLPHGKTFVPPKIVEDWGWKRLALGLYAIKDNALRLNMRVLCDPESYENTLAHETAHAVQYQWLVQVYGPHQGTWPRRYQTPHSEVWIAAQQRMGYRLSVTKSVDIAKAFPEKYAGAHCSCGRPHALTRSYIAKHAGQKVWSVCKCGKQIPMEEFKGAGASQSPCKYGRTKRGTCRRRPRR